MKPPRLLHNLERMNRGCDQPSSPNRLQPRLQRSHAASNPFVLANLAAAATADRRTDDDIYSVISQIGSEWPLGLLLSPLTSFFPFFPSSTQSVLVGVLSAECKHCEMAPRVMVLLEEFVDGKFNYFVFESIY